MEGIEGNIETIDGNVESMEANIETVEKNMEKLEGTRKMMEENMKRIEVTRKRMEGSMEMMEASMELMEGNMERMGVFIKSEPYEYYEPEKRKRKNFSILEKLKILEELDSVKSVKAIMEKYGVPERTLRGWKGKRFKLEELNNTYILTNNSKRIRVTPLDQLEEALYIWFKCTIESGISLTGPLVTKKALELHKEMGIEKKFVASEGWLNHWKNKYGIRQYAVYGKRFSTDVPAAPVFRDDIENMIKENELQLCQIFNAEKTDLNGKMMPKKSFAEKSQIKLTELKERHTVILCTNGDASMKLPLVVIGKSTKPKSLHTVSQGTLPVHYVPQTNGWMTAEIFENWFRNEFVPRVTAFLTEKGLPAKALLFVDYAPCYASFDVNAIEGDIKIRFLRANTSEVLQPVDRTITDDLKRRYKLHFLHSILFAQKNGINLAAHLRSITIKDILYWMSDVWDGVTEGTILKHWKKILPSHYDDNSNEEMEQTITDDDILSNIRQINEYQDAEERSVQSWISTKENDTTEKTTVPTNTELIELVAQEYAEENMDETDVLAVNVHPNNVVAAADTILSFYEENGLLSASDLAVIRKAKQLAIKIAISE